MGRTRAGDCAASWGEVSDRYILIWKCCSFRQVALTTPTAAPTATPTVAPISTHMGEYS